MCVLYAHLPVLLGTFTNLSHTVILEYCIAQLVWNLHILESEAYKLAEKSTKPTSTTFSFSAMEILDPFIGVKMDPQLNFWSSLRTTKRNQNSYLKFRKMVISFSYCL